MIGTTTHLMVLFFLLQMSAWLNGVSAADASAREVKEHMVLACGSPPPESAAEWRERAAAIVRVRLYSQATYDNLSSPVGPEPMTAHEGAVLDLVKAHPQVPATGTSLTILQRGGTVVREDGLHRYRWNNFDIMPVETEWVLFLYWNEYLHGFEVLHFEDGAFQIQWDAITTNGRAPFARKWNGRGANAFLAALRGSH